MIVLKIPFNFVTIDFRRGAALLKVRILIYCNVKIYKILLVRQILVNGNKNSKICGDGVGK